MIEIWYNIDSNGIEVHTEYLVYGINELIGSIGGTLGLFIGFSFIDLLSRLINTIKKFLLQHTTGTGKSPY